MMASQEGMRSDIGGVSPDGLTEDVLEIAKTNPTELHKYLVARMPFTRATASADGANLLKVACNRSSRSDRRGAHLHVPGNRDG